MAGFAAVRRGDAPPKRVACKSAGGVAEALKPSAKRDPTLLFYLLCGVVVIPEIKRISGKVVSMMWRSSFKVFVSAPPVAPVAPTFPV